MGKLQREELRLEEACRDDVQGPRKPREALTAGHHYLVTALRNTCLWRGEPGSSHQCSKPHIYDL